MLWFGCICNYKVVNRLGWLLHHLHLKQPPLQEHLISSLHALETSGMVIQPTFSLWIPFPPDRFVVTLYCCLGVLLHLQQLVSELQLQLQHSYQGGSVVWFQKVVLQQGVSFHQDQP